MNNPNFQMAMLHLKILCDIETPKMKKTPQDRARGALLLGLLFVCVNIYAGDIYFKSKEG